MSETRRIAVKTIGYYHRDSELNVTLDLRPRTLNSNKIYFEDPSHHRLKPINLNINVPDYGAGELKMESLLDYIGLKGWPNDTPPQIVTNRHLLKTIAADYVPDMEIMVFRFDGVVFLLRLSEDEPRLNPHLNFAAVFENFFTEGSRETVRKGVFLAEIPARQGSRESFSVMYSGEIDAIDDDGNHVEFKVFSEGVVDHFWKNLSSVTYWQAVFGDVKTLVIGGRTGKSPKVMNTWPRRTVPKFSVHKVEQLPPHLIPEKQRNFCKSNPTVKEWTVSEGEARLTQFLDLVKNAAKSDREAFLIKKDKESGWTIEQDSDSEVIREFQEAVRSRLKRYH